MPPTGYSYGANTSRTVHQQWPSLSSPEQVHGTVAGTWSSEGTLAHLCYRQFFLRPLSPLLLSRHHEVPHYSKLTHWQGNTLELCTYHHLREYIS